MLNWSIEASATFSWETNIVSFRRQLSTRRTPARLAFAPSASVVAADEAPAVGSYRGRSRACGSTVHSTVTWNRAFRLRVAPDPSGSCYWHHGSTYSLVGCDGAVSALPCSWESQSPPVVTSPEYHILTFCITFILHATSRTNDLCIFYVYNTKARWWWHLS